MNSSETSSEETDQQEEEEVQDDSGGTKRSYECTFCRRGFTNAQALGGHMNIHRKDRAKAKQLQVGTANSSSSQFPILNKFPSNEESLLASSPPFLSNHPTSYYSIFEGQRNYSMYFQPPPPPNPRHPPPYAFPYEYLNPRSQSLDMNQELLGANLSLQIGPSHEENNEVRRRIQNDEVDLELRLGHDPY